MNLQVSDLSRLTLVPEILENVCRLTGLGFATVAVLTTDRWIACSVHDETGLGLKAGDQLPVEFTICDRVRTSGRSVLLDHASEDENWSNHPLVSGFGIRSGLSVPILRPNGDLVATLCALDRTKVDATRPEIMATIKLFANLIALSLHHEEQMSATVGELEEAVKVSNLREEFIAVLGHDLRNPLAAVSSGVDLLQRNEDLSERGQTIIGMMRESMKRAAGLIDDVLDFARGRLGGGIAIERHGDVALDSVLAEVVEEARMFAPEMRIEAEFHIDQPVSCDSERIAQMVSNLVGNAVTHGDPALPIRVSGRREGELCVIDVTNGGGPIPADVRGKLFEPFFRSATGQSRQGLGLGLYIANQIAKAHDGLIEVDSNDYRTMFSVRFSAAPLKGLAEDLDSAG
ncbi:GAF domain-containing sensor histidine kinase [Croceicoccus sp. F390]|uniref:histidine kinase n=1 Tax=Croceicoccus esteveae TaxID=3075597 RepID=A0ABU2ZJQ1_9SPHN|nr:GAF domain-containing sensor histidine kinase [Croceicoccus sp. F390]MDT0576830.1 GAF domain-containing sensor histidine kinase [Croceicoccus sp. F390]